ncbi:MAG TPA: hypothetical protein VNG71_22630, partial [Pyrinomonadaceae bacterium]|nr:hypothetical protein [Pyrinomonadaceae bacterium]
RCAMLFSCSGAVVPARNFLRILDLAPFGVTNPEAFTAQLDRTTEQLRTSLPRACQNWGLARKILNIFLLDCSYTSHLVSVYHLHRSEPFLELPLDSITAKALRKAAKKRGESLPSWPGVKHLTQPISASYQNVAAAEGAANGIARVHLDALWWSLDRD